MTNDNAPKRDTITCELPISKIKVVLKSFLIGEEKLKLVENPKTNFIPWAMENIIVSGIDLEKLKQLHGKDFDFLVNEMGKIINDSSWLPKKKDSSDNIEKS